VRRTNIFLFFLLPFAGIVVIFSLFSWLNRADIKRKTTDLIREQLKATAAILRVNISHFLEERYPPEKILDFSTGEEDIYYLALLDSRKNILVWRSRYEGYLPLSKEDVSRTEPWTIISPAGRILNVLEPLSLKTGEGYFLYAGYSLSRLDEMLARSDRNFLLIFGFLVAAGILFFFGVFGLQKNYLAKTREAEEERKEKERFREISAFTSAVAHEIKNPLNSLSLLCELILRKGPPEAKTEAIQAKAEVSKISEIIDRFSSALKPLRLKKEEFPLQEAILSAWNSLAAAGLNPAVDFRYIESRPIRISADRELLIRALANLLQNAYEATDKGTVVIEAEKIRKKVLIRLTDTGKGMEKDQLDHIFDAFFSTKDRGMGIGLYLAKKIIEAHNGRIDVQSEPGRGTTFIIQLPGGRHE